MGTVYKKSACLNELMKKYSGLSACIHDWEFSSVPWVMEEKNAERDKLCKDVQEVLMQIGVLSNTLDRVARAMESWAEKAELQVTADALKVIRVAELQVRPCQSLVGEMILVGMFVQGERAGKTVEQVRDGADFKPAVQYVTKTLKVAVADLDKNLRDRIQGTASECSSPAPSASAAEPEPSADTAAAPRKKRARLSGGSK